MTEQVKQEQQKACEHLHPILQMLWAITRGQIRAGTCTLDQSAEGKIWSTDCHHLCMIPLLIPVPALLPANANQLQVQMHPEFEATINEAETGYLAITSMMDKGKLKSEQMEKHSRDYAANDHHSIFNL